MVIQVGLARASALGRGYSPVWRTQRKLSAEVNQRLAVTPSCMETFRVRRREEAMARILIGKSENIQSLDIAGIKKL